MIISEFIKSKASIGLSDEPELAIVRIVWVLSEGAWSIRSSQKIPEGAMQIFVQLYATPNTKKFFLKFEKQAQLQATLPTTMKPCGTVEDIDLIAIRTYLNNLLKQNKLIYATDEEEQGLFGAYWRVRGSGIGWNIRSAIDYWVKEKQ